VGQEQPVPFAVEVEADAQRRPRKPRHDARYEEPLRIQRGIVSLTPQPAAQRGQLPSARRRELVEGIQMGVAAQELGEPAPHRPAQIERRAKPRTERFGQRQRVDDVPERAQPNDENATGRRKDRARERRRPHRSNSSEAEIGCRFGTSTVKW
jgi:hypothetical protein